MKTGISEELCIYLIQLYPEICQILLIFDRVVNNVHGIVNVKILQIFIYTRESACAALNGAHGLVLLYKAEILIVYCPCVVVQLVLACPLSAGRSIPSIEIKAPSAPATTFCCERKGGRLGDWNSLLIRALSSIHLPIPFHFFVPDSRVQSFTISKKIGRAIFSY